MFEDDRVAGRARLGLFQGVSDIEMREQIMHQARRKFKRVTKL